MATLLYQEKENGDLKLVAEVDNDNPVLALDELLDEYPKLAGEEFVALNDGHVLRVSAESNEIVNSRRSITVSGNLVASADIVDEAEDEGVDVEEEPALAPAPRRRSSAKKRTGRKSAAKKRTPAKKTAAKKAPAKKRPAAKKAAAKKSGNPLAGKKSGGFRRNAASAE